MPDAGSKREPAPRFKNNELFQLEYKMKLKEAIQFVKRRTAQEKNRKYFQRYYKNRKPNINMNEGMK